MKNTILPIIALFAFIAFSQASDPHPQMWDVIYGSANLKRLDQLKELITQGADVNAPIGFDRMLNEGENPSSSTRHATAWPLDVAVQQAQVDMVRLLLANGAKFHGGELAKAAFAGNHQESLIMLTALIEAGADVNSPDAEYGHTSLFWASAKGNKKAVKLLLAQPGINLDIVNIDGDTALIAAMGNGDAEIIEMLLKAGANVSIANKHGETAISRAQRGLKDQQARLAKQQAIISTLQTRSK
jgi:hypothetical protein